MFFVTAVNPESAVKRFKIYELTPDSGDVNEPKALLMAEALFDKLLKNCFNSFKRLAAESGSEIGVVNIVCNA